MSTSTTHRRLLGTALVAGCLLSSAGCSVVDDLFGSPAPVAAAPVAGLTCTSPKPTPLTLVVGARANSPQPNPPEMVQKMIEETAKGAQPISVVQVDGAPRVSMSATFKTDAQSTDAQENELKKFTTNFSTLLGQLKPKTPEADVFEALRAAALATPSGGTIVLLDSGITTKGQLSFVDGDMFSAAQNPDEVTGYLSTNHLLPDLSGRSVILVDVGQTADPQPGLNEDLTRRVVSLWDHVAHSAGASCTQTVEDTTSRTPLDTGGIGVTPVALPAEPIYKPCSATVLSDGGPVGFNGDVAQFRDENAARAALQPLADAAKRGNMTVNLVGTTAGARTKTFRDQLSKDRAEAVKAILVAQGVNADRITTVGAGSDSKYQVPDGGPNGQLLPG